MLTVREVAEILKVSTKTIHRRIGDGTIRAVKLGVRIEKEELERFIRDRKGEAS